MGADNNAVGVAARWIRNLRSLRKTSTPAAGFRLLELIDAMLQVCLCLNVFVAKPELWDHEKGSTLD
jgi:hypothetical protein